MSVGFGRLWYVFGIPIILATNALSLLVHIPFFVMSSPIKLIYTGSLCMEFTLCYPSQVYLDVSKPNFYHFKCAEFSFIYI